MKLRKFEFRKAKFYQEEDGKDVEAGFIDYRLFARELLFMGGKEGLGFEQQEKSTDISRKMKNAHVEGKKFVYLEKSEWDHLVERVKAWRSGGFGKEAATDFIRYVANLPEEEVEVKAAKGAKP